MQIQAMRARLPLVVFVFVALVCLALLGFACACLTDQPVQALERAVAALAVVPPVAEAWPAAVLAFLIAASLMARGSLVSASSPAALQRFLL